MTQIILPELNEMRTKILTSVKHSDWLKQIICGPGLVFPVWPAAAPAFPPVLSSVAVQPSSHTSASDILNHVSGTVAHNLYGALADLTWPGLE